MELKGSWQITDMPRRDLYPDRCRPLSDRDIDPLPGEESSITMSIVAHTHPFVIGVDAHARTHSLAILAGRTGELVDEGQFPATVAGLERAIAWGARRTEADPNALWVIEGVGTYGARLARMTADAGYTVVEAARMNARAHRGVGKSDPLDARRIAQAVLPLDDSQLRRPRADQGVRAALRVLIASRDHINNERTASINALIALLRVVDLGIDARGTLTASQVDTLASWRGRREELSISTARAEAIRLAKRIRVADQELAGHLGRVRSEAAFASLAGVNPIPASSGNTVRHRINRGGDRRLNRALHMAVVTRMRMDPDTRAYVAKRTAQGRTLREIRRSLKRYLARQIYRQLNTAASAATAA